MRHRDYQWDSASAGLHPGTPQWEAMWAALAQATGDPADECPENGEVWQYMGTYAGAHQFRHRHRPATAQPIARWGAHRDRVYLELDAQTLQVVHCTSRLYEDPTPAARPATLRSAHLTGPDRPIKPIDGASDRPGSDYGGAFDGFQVTSDADPGL